MSSDDLRFTSILWLRFYKHVFLPSLLEFTLICESGQTTKLPRTLFPLAFTLLSFRKQTLANITSKNVISAGVPPEKQYP